MKLHRLHVHDGKCQRKAGNLENKGETSLKKIFKLCSLSAWEMLTSPAEIGAMGRTLTKGQGKVTSLCFDKFHLRCVGSVLLEMPNWQATENKNLNSLGEGRAGECC